MVLIVDPPAMPLEHQHGRVVGELAPRSASLARSTVLPWSGIDLRCGPSRVASGFSEASHSPPPPHPSDPPPPATPIAPARRHCRCRWRTAAGWRRVSRRRADAALQPPDRLRHVRIVAPFVVVRLLTRRPLLRTPTAAAARRDVAARAMAVQGDVPRSGMRSTSRWYSMSSSGGTGTPRSCTRAVAQQVHRVRLGEPGARSQSAALPGSACVTSSGDRCLARQALREPATTPPSTAATAAPTAPSNRLPTANALAASAAAGARRARARRTGDEEPPRACGHRPVARAGAGHDRPGGARGERGERGLCGAEECATAASRETGGGADRARRFGGARASLEHAAVSKVLAPETVHLDGQHSATLDPHIHG